MRDPLPDGRDFDQLLERMSEEGYGPVRKQLASAETGAELPYSQKVVFINQAAIEEENRWRVTSAALRKYMAVFGISPEQVVIVQKHNGHPVEITIGGLLNRVEGKRGIEP